jgi:hypothetical protein
VNAPLTASSDPRHVMPETAVARLDAVRHAIDSLTHEQRRLERLGLELPLARCQHQLRYWRFLEGLLAVAAGERPATGKGLSWLDASSR